MADGNSSESKSGKVDGPARPAGPKQVSEEMTAMDQENEHIRRLIAARDREVEQRRNVADALAQAYERGETERMREAFISLQNTIEAIERAIQHEKTLVGAGVPS